jgi:hypothetical protein
VMMSDKEAAERERREVEETRRRYQGIADFRAGIAEHRAHAIRETRDLPQDRLQKLCDMEGRFILGCAHVSPYLTVA